jgi:hypothetical protein
MAWPVSRVGPTAHRATWQYGRGNNPIYFANTPDFLNKQVWVCPVKLPLVP